MALAELLFPSGIVRAEAELAVPKTILSWRVLYRLVTLVPDRAEPVPGLHTRHAPRPPCSAHVQPCMIEITVLHFSDTIASLTSTNSIGREFEDTRERRLCQTRLASSTRAGGYGWSVSKSGKHGRTYSVHLDASLYRLRKGLASSYRPSHWVRSVDS